MTPSINKPVPTLNNISHDIANHVVLNNHAISIAEQSATAQEPPVSPTTTKLTKQRTRPNLIRGSRSFIPKNKHNVHQLQTKQDKTQACITNFFTKPTKNFKTRPQSTSQDSVDIKYVSTTDATNNIHRKKSDAHPVMNYPCGDIDIIRSKSQYSKIKRKYELVPKSEPVHRKHKFDKP